MRAKKKGSGMKITAPKGWHSPLCQASPPKLGSSVLPRTHPLTLDFPAQSADSRTPSILGRGGVGGAPKLGGEDNVAKYRDPQGLGASVAGRTGMNLASLFMGRAVHRALAGWVFPSEELREPAAAAWTPHDVSPPGSQGRRRLS